MTDNRHLDKVHFLYGARIQGLTQGGGLGLTPPLELDILQKLYYLRKEINCFRILFAC